MPAPFHAGYRRGAPSLRRSALLCALFALCAVVTAGMAARGPAWMFVFPAIAVAGALPLYVLTARAFWRAARGRPLLTLDAHGVRLHSARVALPWANVAEVRVVTAPPDVRTIVFVPADAATALTGLRGLPRRFAKDGIARQGGPVFIRTDSLAVPLTALLTAIRTHTEAPIVHRCTPRP